MGAFACTAGIAIENQTPLENRLQQIAHRMVHYPITERSSANPAALGVEYLEGEVGAGTERVSAT